MHLRQKNRLSANRFLEIFAIASVFHSYTLNKSLQTIRLFSPDHERKLLHMCRYIANQEKYKGWNLGIVHILIEISTLTYNSKGQTI
jgi:hypothetical protein